MKRPDKNYTHKLPGISNYAPNLPVPDFRLLFESVPGLYLVLDPALRIVAASNAYLHATMTKREEILGRNLFEVFPDNPADPQAGGVRNLAASLQRVLHSRTTDVMPTQKYDIRRPLESGGAFEERYWSPVNSPVFGSNHEITYIIHRVEDVTDFVHQSQKRIELEKFGEELQLQTRTQTEKMEVEIFTRSQEIAQANQKLKEANEELGRLYEKTKELDQLKTTFFANISHDLRTPLTLILGPVEGWLKTPGLPDKQRHELELINRNANLLLKHVNDLLDLSRIVVGQVVMRYAEIDLAHQVRLVSAAFESLVAEKGIRYDVDTPPKAVAEVDAEKCQRILINLLANAVKFTPSGGVIAVVLRMEGDRAVIRVQDTGPGIPEHLREAVFERFRQVGEGVTRRLEGTGLGLSIVKEFVMLHRGEVAVTETPGGGALFSIALPLYAPAGVFVQPQADVVVDDLDVRRGVDEVVAQVPLSKPAQIPVPDTELHSGAPLILIVDDNPDMNAFESELFSHTYRVINAYDGEEGLQKALSMHPDLILSDVMMPRMSGDRMVQALRRNREMDNTPIILVTAKADEEFLVRMLKEGVQAYFRKPFFVGELLVRVDGFIAEKKLKEALQESEERFRCAVLEAPMPIMLHAEGGEVIQVNRIWSELTGFLPEEVPTIDSWIDKAYPETKDFQKNRIFDLDSMSTKTKVGEFVITTKKGEHRVWDVSAAPLGRLPDGRQLVMSMAADITDRKRVEDRLQQTLENLERSNKDLQQFANIVSHDLQEPLRTVASYGELLKQRYQGKLDEKADRFIGFIVEGTNRMATLINDLLAYSRVGTRSKKSEPRDMEAILKQVKAGLHKIIEENKAEITNDPLPVVEGDDSQLLQLLQNLIGNAIKFRKQNSTKQELTPRIHISVERGQNQWVFGVHDNGIGIEPRFYERIFEIFQRLHTRAEYPGTGIGLTICKKIVERHGGRMWVESRFGEGSSFYFSLPGGEPVGNEQ
jgi:PAS domain S-box-containing protein